jgi:UDP-N-acetylmuramoyl-tripeptide--D-alanyl-D-alanine ligase
VLRDSPGTRKIAVLGSMKELGTFSAECHENVWNRACEVADCVFSLGQEWKPMVDQKKNNKYLLASSFEELIELLEKNLKEGDTVLLKGSRWANQLWRVVDHFQGKL